jgi:hypothetical protein
MALEPKTKADQDKLGIILRKFLDEDPSLRVEYDNETYNIQNWKDLFIDDSKIDLNIFKKSVLKLVDVEKIADKFNHIFAKIEANNNMENITNLARELEILLREEELPNEIEPRFQLCEYHLAEGEKVFKDWQNRMGTIIEKINIAEENTNSFEALKALKEIKESKLLLLRENRYVLSENQEKTIEDLSERAKGFLKINIKHWILEQKCMSVSAMTQYESHMHRIEDLMKELNYFDEAQIAKTHRIRELENKEAIQIRQNLKEDCESFINKININDNTLFNILKENLAKADFLIKQIAKNNDILGREQRIIEEKIIAKKLLIEGKVNIIKSSIDKIWDDISNLTNIEAIQDLESNISQIINKGIDKKDQDDLLELKVALDEFLKAVKSFDEINYSRTKFRNTYEDLIKRYNDPSMEFDFMEAIENIALRIEGTLNEKANKWEYQYINSFSGNLKREEILSWKENTTLLPDYLTKEIIDKYNLIKKKVDVILTEAKIEDIVFLFAKLSKPERKTCLTKIENIE